MKRESNHGAIKCPFCGQPHEDSVLVCPLTGHSLRFTDPQRAIGHIIGGKYRLERLIGKGGMGSVYEATNIQIDKKVAIKTLLPESIKIDQVAERFRREARSAASIGHENIVDIYDLDKTEEGIIYIVMELLKGTDLAEVLKNQKCLPLSRVASIGVQTARALGAAHERGIIHRDLKPENIFLCSKKDGEKVKIVDFGIAMIKEQGSLSRLTTDGVLLGTPYYMSPEQARGSKDLDYRVDIYALGAVLFECLTGTILFSGETYLEVISKHQIEPVPRLQERKKDLVLPERVESIIMKMLEKDPSKRPSSMEEVENALLPYCAGSTYQSISISSSCQKSEEFAETIMDGGASSKILQTTPIKWESKKNRWKQYLQNPFTLYIILPVIFVVSMVSVLLFYNKKSSTKKEAIRSFPITLPEKIKWESPGEKITIEISVNPDDALVIFDGKIVENNSKPIVVEKSNRKATLKVQKPGYITYEEAVPLDKSNIIKVSLAPQETKPGKKAVLKSKGSEKIPTDKQPGKQTDGKGKDRFKVSEESPYEKVEEK